MAMTFLSQLRMYDRAVELRSTHCENTKYKVKETFERAELAVRMQGRVAQAAFGRSCVTTCECG